MKPPSLISNSFYVAQLILILTTILLRVHHLPVIEPVSPPPPVQRTPYATCDTSRYRSAFEGQKACGFKMITSAAKVLPVSVQSELVKPKRGRELTDRCVTQIQIQIQIHIHIHRILFLRSCDVCGKNGDVVIHIAHVKRFKLLRHSEYLRKLRSD